MVFFRGEEGFEEEEVQGVLTVDQVLASSKKPDTEAELKKSDIADELTKSDAADKFKKTDTEAEKILDQVEQTIKASVEETTTRKASQTVLDNTKTKTEETPSPEAAVRDEKMSSKEFQVKDGEMPSPESEVKTDEKAAMEAAEKSENTPSVESKVKPKDLVVKDPMTQDVDNMLLELDDMERLLNEKAKEPEIPPMIIPPIVLPPVKRPEIVAEPLPRMTRADFAKLDDDQLDAIMRKLNKIDSMEQEIVYLREIIDERLNVDFQLMYQNIMEKTNIEAIKTYRNVQAVMVEETAKQNRVLVGIDDKESSIKRRLNNVMFFSIISFVVSILVMLMIILPALGFDILK